MNSLVKVSEELTGRKEGAI